MEKAGKCQPLKSLLQGYISSNSALIGPALVGEGFSRDTFDCPNMKGEVS